MSQNQISDGQMFAEDELITADLDFCPSMKFCSLMSGLKPLDQMTGVTGTNFLQSNKHPIFQRF